jgi:hypothetical protein
MTSREIEFLPSPIDGHVLARRSNDSPARNVCAEAARERIDSGEISPTAVNPRTLRFRPRSSDCSAPKPDRGVTFRTLDPR